MQLDDDGSGFISVDELEEPLVGLGFASTRDDVDAMIKKIDGEDGDGCIEFAEFIKVLKTDMGGEGKAIQKFFKDLSAGKFSTKKELPFMVFV